MKKHLFSYMHEGKPASIQVEAGDVMDARKRLRGLASAQYEGEIVVGMPRMFSWFGRFYVWWMNLGRKE